MYKMKYVKQILIILFISFLGEVCNLLMPLPVPASVYGLLIMFGLLCTGVIKLSMVEDTADLLISVMPLMFIEPTVSIMTIIFDVKDQLVAIFVISILTTAVVVAVTGFVAQKIVRHKQGKETGNE